MRTPIVAVTLALPAALRPGVEAALADVRAAGRVVGPLELADDDVEAPVARAAELGEAEARS